MGAWDSPPTEAEVARATAWDTPPTAEELAAMGATPAGVKTGLAKALGLGALQGSTLGFADEAGAALQAGLLKLSGDPSAFAENYRTARDEARAELRQAEADQPAAYLGGNVLGGVAVPVPGLGAAKAATTAGKVLRAALAGGGLGAGYGLGSSEADTAAGLARDTALGGTIGAATGTVGPLLSKALGYARSGAQRGVNRAVEQETARQAAKVEQAIASQRGKLGAAVQSGSRDLEVLAREAADASLPSSGQAAAFLASPEGAAVREAVLASKAASAPTRIAEIAENRAALEALNAGKQEAIEAGTAAALADPVKRHITPRIATLGHRMLPVALVSAGGLIGGTEGAAVGGGLGAAMSLLQGRPGVIVRNLVREPAVRKAVLERALAALGGAERAGAVVAPVASAGGRSLAPVTSRTLPLWAQEDEETRRARELAALLGGLP